MDASAASDPYSVVCEPSGAHARLAMHGGSNRDTRKLLVIDMASQKKIESASHLHSVSQILCGTVF